MTGGLGADVFAFASASDSFANLAADVISDFEVGIDKISLADLSSGTFLFIGSAPFSGPGPSVQVTSVLGASVVAIDVDGNGTVDMRIMLANAPLLTETDFIL